MKSTQLKKDKKEVLTNNNLFKNSIIASVIGFLSWLSLFILFDPLAGLYKIGKFDLDLNLLTDYQLYLKSLFIGIIFFFFFYLTLKYKEQSKFAKIIMWIGIILYALFYLGYLFLLFFFRFTDL